MDKNELEQVIKTINRPMDKLRIERAEIMAKIEDELQVNADAITKVREENKLKLKELRAKITHEDLTDARGYKIVSELFSFSDFSTVGFGSHIFPDTYVRHNVSYIAGSYAVCFEIAVPKEKDLEKLERTASLLSPVLKAGAQAFPNVRVRIFEDSLSEHRSYSISWDEKGEMFQLNGMNASNSDLLEILKIAPTYC